MKTDPAVRIGISSCLLGEEVRYDGGHKRDPYLVQTLGPMVEWVAVCPEVEVGLGRPRESIRLVRDAKELDAVRLVPLTLVRHHARQADIAYLLGQRYLDPEFQGVDAP